MKDDDIEFNINSDDCKRWSNGLIEAAKGHPEGSEEFKCTVTCAYLLQNFAEELDMEEKISEAAGNDTDKDKETDKELN